MGKKQSNTGVSNKAVMVGLIKKMRAEQRLDGDEILEWNLGKSLWQRKQQRQRQEFAWCVQGTAWRKPGLREQGKCRRKRDQK